MTEVQQLPDEVVEAVGHLVVAAMSEPFPAHELLDFVAPLHTASVMFTFEAPGADFLVVTVTDEDIAAADGFPALQRIIAAKVKRLRRATRNSRLLDATGRALH